VTAAELVARLTGLVKEQADIIKAQADALAQLGAVADIEEKMAAAAMQTSQVFLQRSAYLAFFITSLSRSKEACHEKGH